MQLPLQGLEIKIGTGESRSQFKDLWIEHRASSIENRASSIEHRASSIEHRASSIEHRASSIEHRASSIEHRASSIEHRASSNYNINIDRKSTRLNSSHLVISYAVFCLKKKKDIVTHNPYCLHKYSQIVVHSNLIYHLTMSFRTEILNISY